MNTHGATVNRGEIVSMYAGLYILTNSSCNESGRNLEEKPGKEVEMELARDERRV